MYKQNISFTIAKRFYISRHDILKIYFYFTFLKNFMFQTFPKIEEESSWMKEILERNSYRSDRPWNPRILPWMGKSLGEPFVGQRFSRGAPPATSACVPHFHTSCIPSRSSAKENFHGLEHYEYRATIDPLGSAKLDLSTRICSPLILVIVYKLEKFP